MKTYFEVLIGPLRDRDKDLVSLICFENGCAGIAETLPFQQKTLVYDPEIFEHQPNYFSVYFDSYPSENFILGLQKKFPGLQVQIAQQMEKDWLQLWKENFKPFQFVGNYWIVPSWCRPPREASKYLFIDPGMAFGTGTHESTKLAAHWYLETVIKQCRPFSVLDVGTGTGILAFIAAQEGAKKIVGIDIDPECLRVAQENAKQNQITGVDWRTQLVSTIEEEFDVVFANIVSGVLLQIRDDLFRTVKKGGYLILSGLLREEREEFLEHFGVKHPWQILGHQDLNEWTSLCLQKK